MRAKRIIAVLTILMAMAVAFAAASNAETRKVDGHCRFTGTEIVSDFSSKTIADSVRGLEPGDEVIFTVEFKNDYRVPTDWYMKNEVLTTLEESFDRTENGGYTYRLTHINPDKEREVLFDNSAVGGDSKAGDMEGLHQATNATKEWFFIQTLQKDQIAYTELYVKFDGETEVNDYMDTYGKLKVAYAVELNEEDNVDDKEEYEEEEKEEKEKGSSKKKTRKTKSGKGLIKTGDNNNLLFPVIALIVAGILMVLTVISYMRDRKERD